MNLRKNNKTAKCWKQKVEEKSMYGYFEQKKGEYCARSDMDMVKTETLWEMLNLF